MLRYFYAGRLFISEVKPRAFKPTFQVKPELIGRLYSSSNNSISLFKEEGDRCVVLRNSDRFFASFHPLKPLQVRG
ncbi:MAG: hypothetical protein EWV75_15620 [Microcystis wesenbergii Mw_QC_S_20081001_S30D]|uniref:Uncharacterized protein n=1 Tax=Microcystis wesenbergii Mw_QC_S_20081001_S30D TaxID=2486245 RepID=A0A552JFN0_9CHRO|nr:MAG: hypothetical protein EWV75_15620 [Microcystis wesenbergii Mw_QC_S_20081001_S30D]